MYKELGEAEPLLKFRPHSMPKEYSKFLEDKITAFEFFRNAAKTSNVITPEDSYRFYKYHYERHKSIYFATLGSGGAIFMCDNYMR